MTDQERLELFRKHVESVWSTPTVADTVRFINQELGEADSVAMKLGFQDKEYKRSNELEELELKYALRLELGQTCRITSGILIAKSVLGYAWYEYLYERYTVCHLRERPKFVRPDGSIVGQAKKGVSVFYMGPNEGEFARAFSAYGRIIYPERGKHGN